MKPINYYILFFVMLTIGVTSCNPKKQIINTVSPVEAKANSALFTDMLGHELQFATFSSKLNLSVTTGTRSMTSKAAMKIINNRMVQVSIQPLFGVEVFRFQMDKDTVVVLDRMNKRYVKEAVSDVKKRYPVGFNYNALQSLLTNKLFVAGNPVVTPADYERFSYAETLNSYYLKATDKASNIDYTFTVNADDKITFSHLLDSGNNYSLQWGYTNFALLNNRQFPYKMDVAAGNNAKKKINVGFEFTDIKIDESMELYFSIPTGYTKIELSEIVKIVTAGNS